MKKNNSNYKLRFLNENGNSYPIWETRKIKDIFEVTRGSVLAKNKTKNKKQENNLFPVYSSQTLNNGLLGYYDQYLFEDAITWTTDGANAGDFNFRQGKFYATNVCGILKSNEGYANTFMANLLKKEAKKYVIKLGNSKLMNNIVEEISISFPCIVEQQRIGFFLFEIDNYIELHQKEILLIKEYKKSLLDQIFNKKIKFIDEKKHTYPKWETKKIGDIFEVTRGSVLAKNKIENEKKESYLFPVYSSQTLNNGLLGYYDQFLFEDAITWTTDGLNAGDFNFRQGKFYATNVCGILKNNEGYANTFMACLLKREAKKYVVKLGNSKLMNNIVAEIPISFPCIIEQEKIGNLIFNINEQIIQLELEFKNLCEYKNTLLNKLIF